MHWIVRTGFSSDHLGSQYFSIYIYYPAQTSVHNYSRELGAMPSHTPDSANGDDRTQSKKRRIPGACDICKKKKSEPISYSHVIGVLKGSVNCSTL